MVGGSYPPPHFLRVNKKKITNIFSCINGTEIEQDMTVAVKMQ